MWRLSLGLWPSSVIVAALAPMPLSTSQPRTLAGRAAHVERLVAALHGATRRAQSGGGKRRGHDDGHSFSRPRQPAERSRVARRGSGRCASSPGPRARSAAEPRANGELDGSGPPPPRERAQHRSPDEHAPPRTSAPSPRDSRRARGGRCVRCRARAAHARRTRDPRARSAAGADLSRRARPAVPHRSLCRRAQRRARARRVRALRADGSGSRRAVPAQQRELGVLRSGAPLVPARCCTT